MRDIQSKVNEYSIYESWIHIELDEKPKILDSLEFSVDETYVSGEYPSGINNFSKINFNAAFAIDTIWEYFYKKNVTILNIGLDHLVVSLIHYIEFVCKVPYRKLIQINGTVISEKKTKNLIYDFYARDKNCIYALD